MFKYKSVDIVSLYRGPRYGGGGIRRGVVHMQEGGFYCCALYKFCPMIFFEGGAPMPLYLGYYSECCSNHSDDDGDDDNNNIY